MNLLVVAVSCFVLAQASADSDPFQPQVVPSQDAPANAGDSAPSPGGLPPAAPEEPFGGPSSAPDPGLGEPSPLEPSPFDADAPTAAPPETAPAASATDLGDRTGPLDSTDEPEPAGDLAPLGSVPRQRLRPPEIVAQALASPRERGLTGAPLTLVAALSRSGDRTQQLRIAQAYWRLTAAQAAYHWALEERDLVERYLQARAEAPAVNSARSAAAANVRDAQLEVAEAQQQLGDLVGTVAGELPLSVDRPHVGSYTTLFEQLFSGRQAPPRIRLIHRTLPLRRQAIDAHGAAIVATLDAVEATGDEFATGGQGLATLLMLFDRLHEERQRFMTAVRAYNDSIAEYLLAIATPGTSDEVLVSRLILTTPAATRPDLSPGGRSTLPSNNPSNNPPSAPSSNPAVPQTFDTAPADGNGAAGQPTVADPATEPRTSNYQPADVDALLTNGGGMYQGLVDLQPPARVQKLSGLLHWYRAAPTDSDRRTELADCLRDVATNERLAVLTAYWRTCEAAARQQLLSDEVEQLNALMPVLSALGNQPEMAAAGVRFQAARRQFRAQAVEAQLALVDAEFELTQAAGRRLEDPWLLPATPPQAGRYVVSERDTGSVRRAGEAVSSRHFELQERADAVLQADRLRASLGGETAQLAAEPGAADGPGELTSLDRAIWAIDHQSRQTQAFLRNLTEYNGAIARYALAHLPAGIPSEELVKKLVVVRTVRGES
ncbi:MAG: hypothetical protein WD845_11300 [Pirellulales bacterium]